MGPGRVLSEALILRRAREERRVEGPDGVPSSDGCWKRRAGRNIATLRARFTRIGKGEENGKEENREVEEECSQGVGEHRRSAARDP